MANKTVLFQLHRAGIILIFLFSIPCLYSQKTNITFNNPKIEGFTIGDKINPKILTKIRDISFPNYLDGWNYKNIYKLPEKYEGLPIAIYKLNKNENIRFTLIDDIIIKIFCIHYTETKKDSIISALEKKIGFASEYKEYGEPSSSEDYRTFWLLYTWEGDGKIIQVGTSYLKFESNAEKKPLRWDLLCSDLYFEDEIIKSYEKKGN